MNVEDGEDGELDDKNDDEELWNKPSCYVI